MIFYLISILVVIADQLAKYLIRLYLPVGETLHVWGFLLTHYENAGMAFSLFQGYARLFAVAAVLFVMGVFYYRKKAGEKRFLMEAGLGFLVGGAVGNAIDRILFGRVTDFLVSSSGNGILNLADHAINIGIVLLFLDAGVGYVRRFKRK
ncbi:lipoprotein signal peptidase [Brevibacillus reuszeri]|uniref:Lipoprotein signal peptidase n=1 Tax=Brevibacillus reuszeri TaxID=54915 RepID=A0A0K9YVJ5_9BACL|nr:signal peptidase II [Brevibacillus reuszeri]KNB72701.1 signal peptidase II [Brevibacillus reuszeri]MED1860599.1 signal peptidase II [Brevibacillus reuszeri]GED70267.1 lipoprotein signal peptidase [Brevibacillus reuszeri]